MNDRVVFWYGCNVLRHGDIIHSAIEVLRAVGIESSPVGGPSYCCGNSKDGNLRTSEGMSKRTVEKFGWRRDQGLAVCSISRFLWKWYRNWRHKCGATSAMK